MTSASFQEWGLKVVIACDLYVIVGSHEKHTVWLYLSMVWPGQGDIHENHGEIVVFHLQNYLAKTSESIAKICQVDWILKTPCALIHCGGTERQLKMMITSPFWAGEPGI